MVEFEHAFAADIAAVAACKVAAVGASAGELCESTCSRMVDVCNEIAELPAQNMEHVRLKARALHWLMFADGVKPATTNERLTQDLLRAVLDREPVGAFQ